jgi:hypothetical protein
MREEGKLPSLLATNPKRHYMVDANEVSTSNLVQIHAITTLRRGRYLTIRWKRRKISKLSL